jgi:hypothetical protein
MSYTSLDEVLARREEMMLSSSGVCLAMTKLFYILVDFRYLVGYSGLVGMLLTMLI